jgi:hypothetical protein
MRFRALFAFLLLFQLAGAQEGKLSMRAGYSFPFAPWGVWSEEVTSLYANNDLTFYPGDGYVLTFDADLKSRKEFLSYRLGAFYHYGSRYDVFEDDNQLSEAWLYLSGAGIYGGISLKAGWEHFGIINNYSAGIFSFDYRGELQYASKLGVMPVSTHIGEAVSGPGGKFELGFYGEYKRLGIYPSFQMIFTHNRLSQSLLLKTINISAGYSF